MFSLSEQGSVHIIVVLLATTMNNSSKCYRLEDINFRIYSWHQNMTKNTNLLAFDCLQCPSFVSLVCVCVCVYVCAGVCVCVCVYVCVC